MRTEGQRLRKANRKECWLDIISFCLSDGSGSLLPHAPCLLSNPLLLTDIHPSQHQHHFLAAWIRGKREDWREGRRTRSVSKESREEERIQRGWGAACLLSLGLIVIMIYFLMSSAALPSASQRPDWIWRSISMLKRPSFICELLTDSGYHLCNCSVYWSQREGGRWREAEEEGESWGKTGREGLDLKSGDKRKRGENWWEELVARATSLYVSIWYGWDFMQRAGNSLFE